TAIFEAGTWLPTEGRRSNADSDDWRWTLRSTANRPLLRLTGEATGPVSRDEVSSSADRPSRTVSEGRVAFMAGDGSFGNGGTHQLFMLDRAGLDGDVSVFRANLGDTQVPGANTSIAVSAGMEHQRAFGGETRVLVSYDSHPELINEKGVGLQVLRAATSEKIVLGDVFVVDAGTLLTAEHMLGNRVTSAPYLRAAFHASPEVALEYRLATDPELQRDEDADDLGPPDETLSDAEGRPLPHKALHQEVVAIETREKMVLSVAVYHDSIPVEGVQGGGSVLPAGATDQPVLSDAATQTFRVALHGTSSTGMRLAWQQSFNPVLSACVESEFGTAMAGTGPGLRLDTLGQTVKPRMSGAIAAGVQLTGRRTGTTMKARYRWQPAGTLTQIDEFDARPGDAFLGISLKQRLWSGHRLKGVNAVLEATNLLAEGYQPIAGSDGDTFFLAQVPRALQAGLAFSF
ncbi:MAG TPA: hypothetical protein VKV02_13835, partial [Acidobacteriaceae bacterium]|nr:hypothetical protein [Acidobacteriaceae bacterium]